MSWSAPSSGSAAPPYQAATPYYQQSAPPPGQPPSAPTTYPPKRKGNPVITRYPPPPGYRPPQPPSGQPPYGQNQYPPPAYQQPQQAYPPQPGYPPQPFSQGYQGYPQAHPVFQPSQGYPPGWQPPPGYPPPLHSYQQPPPPLPDAPGAPLAYPPSGWQQSPTFPPGGQAASYPPSLPDAAAISPTTTVPPGTGNSSPSQGSRPSRSRRNTRTASINPTEVPESHKLYQSETYTINLGLDEWDQTDFDGAIWPKANEPIDSSFSLGVIMWHPADETTRALPSDFVAAEERSAKPPLPKIGNGESISEYFGPENSHEAFLNVRQTDEWDTIRFDSIFYEFPASSDIVALEDVLANRDRPDLEIEEPSSHTHVSGGKGGKDISDWNVMDNLEQALSSEQAAGEPKKGCGQDHSSTPSVARDDAQEALLASLGVTGSPKPIKPLSSPPLFPAQPQLGGKRKSSDDERQHFDPTHSRPSTTTKNGHGPQHSQPPPSHLPLPPHLHSPPNPPPSQHERSPLYDPWKVDQAPTRNGERRQSPAKSENSQHTATGSDFHMEDNDPFNTDAPNPPHPKLHRADSSAGRKRSYEETESPQRQEDDYTPRIKRRQPHVAAAYGRR